MQRTRFARHFILSLAACGFLTVLVQGGCAESQDIEAVLLPDAGGSATGGSQTLATGGSQGSGTGGNTQSGSGGSNGSGGFTATGGSLGTGGGRATGGSLGTGGVVATGGTVGTGGSRGTGGVLGSGGMTGNGGARASGGTVGAGGAGAAVTFTQVYQMVLTPKCAGSSCHSPGSQGGVSFASQSSAYSAVNGRVAAGNANSSSFYTLLTSGQMPRGQAKLSTTLLNLVAAWINAGALNN